MVRRNLFLTIGCLLLVLPARRADYKYPRQAAYANISKDYIRQKIKERLSSKVMLADEVLTRLSEQARVDIATFFMIREDGKGVVVDWDKILSEQGHLIKSITFGAHGPKIEVYDAQSALAHLAKHHGLLTNKLEVTGKDGGPIVFKAEDLTDDELARIAKSGSAGAAEATPGT